MISLTHLIYLALLKRSIFLTDSAHMQPDRQQSPIQRGQPSPPPTCKAIITRFTLDVVLSFLYPRLSFLYLRFINGGKDNFLEYPVNLYIKAFSTCKNGLLMLVVYVPSVIFPKKKYQTI